MIKLEHVTKRFGSFTAVDDLCLEVPRGEFFCFLGPNGAGKTTTIKMLCGLLRATAGRIEVDGHDVRREMDRIRAVLGYVPDSPYLYEHLTVHELYAFVGSLYRIPRATVRRREEEAFVLFGLEPYADTLVRDLSHGWRQRLTYAVTFLHEPRVLLVDEPFVGLDPHSIRLINELLRAQARAGAAVFLTTHILALIEGLADRVGILSGGRLVALGSLPDLRRQTQMDGGLEDLFLRLTEPAAAAPAPAGGGAP